MPPTVSPNSDSAMTGEEEVPTPQHTSADGLRDLKARVHHWAGLASLLWSYSHDHVRQFAFGAVSAIAVVCLRLSLPWTLKAALKPWLAHGPGKGERTRPGDLSLFGDAALMAGAFLLLLALLGLADMLSRVSFARFAIGTIRDLRAAAFRAALSSDRVEHDLRAGDVIARLVGDTTRIKAGVKGFLIHVATNGLHYLGATAMLLWISVPLGTLFALCGVALLIVTYIGATRMYDRAAQYRSKEGKLADTIQWAWDDDGGEVSFAKINRASGSYEAALTKVQGMATWAAHVVFGLCVVACFWLGLASPIAQLDRGEMVVFVLYALTLRSPVVQLVRQGVRTGKILACMARLDQLLKTSAGEGASADAGESHDLQRAMCFIHVKACTSKAKGRRKKLGYVDLSIGAGQRVAVVGPPGSGKTTLLRLFAGLERPKKGAVLWDEREVTCSRIMSSAARPFPAAALLPQQPKWRRMKLRSLLHLAEGEPTEAQQRVLDGCGIAKLTRRLPDGLDTRVGSHELSEGESRAVYLARVLLGPAPVLFLDEPAEGVSSGSGTKAVEAALGHARGRTVIAAFRKPVAVEGFDRVIALKKGKVVFDGVPGDWKSWDAAQPEAASRIANTHSGVGA
jgi:ABC-type multidrug transport system fused ATPase/permease subunit